MVVPILHEQPIRARWRRVLLLLLWCTVAILVGIPTHGFAPPAHHGPLPSRGRRGPREDAAFLRCKSRNNPHSSTSTASSTAGDDAGPPRLRGLYPSSIARENGTLVVDEPTTTTMTGPPGGRPRTTVSQRHEIYYEVHGAIDAPLTALFLHGGPGAGCFPNHARFFDPTLYRIVLMDQRGSGRSIPRGETRGNTLSNLCADIESLRRHLNIDRWSTVLGGSWGTTVALAYAQEYPHRVRSMILRGVCLFRAPEIDWIFTNAGYAASLQRPAAQRQGQHDPATAWADFAGAVSSPNNESDSSTTPPLNPRETMYRYYDRLMGDSASLRIRAARSWMRYEMQVYSSSSSSSSSLPGQTNGTVNKDDKNNDNATVVAVLQDSKWSYQDESGNVLSEQESSWSSSISSIIDATGLPRRASADLGQSIRDLSSSLPVIPEEDDDILASPRPVQAVPLDETAIVDEQEDEASSTFVPAQNMLTCYYSVNRKFVMGGIDLLDPVRMQRLRHVFCLAVHGRQDQVCPVATALDLATAWPQKTDDDDDDNNDDLFQLRIPLRSGHSMYDPAITNELVRATDRVAQRLLLPPPPSLMNAQRKDRPAASVAQAEANRTR